MQTLTTIAPLALGGILLAACRAAQVPAAEPTPLEPPATSTTGPRAAAAEPEVAVPVGDGEDGEEAESPFAHLLRRYDRDGDGVIAAHEYTRQVAQFARWDRDGDGCLTAADWEGQELEIGPQIRDLMKARLLGRYFQSDADARVLRLEELPAAFAAYEGSQGDWELTRTEFEARAEERAVDLPGDDSLMMQSYVRASSPWRNLVRAFDEDGSRTLAMFELGAFLEGQGVEELRFDLDRCDGGQPGEVFERIDLDRGLAEGSPVPDLALARLDGEGTVALSDFTGKVPVALIFGSYT